MFKFSDRGFRLLFIIAALWNFGASIQGLAMPKFMITMVYGDGAVDMILNSTYAYTGYNLTMIFVLIFGLGFYIVSRDIAQNRAVVQLGVIEKFVFFWYYSYLFMKGAATGLMLGIVIVDLLFGLMFILFLLQKRSGNQ